MHNLFRSSCTFKAITISFNEQTILNKVCALHNYRNLYIVKCNSIEMPLNMTANRSFVRMWNLLRAESCFLQNKLIRSLQST